MMKMEGMAPLNMVKEEVVVTLKQIEGHLRLFAEEHEERDAAAQAIFLLEQIHGVFKLIYLNAAALLARDLAVALDAVRSQENTFSEHALQEVLISIGHGLLVLGDYVEFVHQKQHSSPVLLVPTINELHRHIGLELISELDVISAEVPYQQLAETPLVDGAEMVGLDEIPQRARRLRHLYQVGLLGVMQGDQVDLHLKMMTQALERLARLTGDVPLAQLWWIGLAVVEAFGLGQVRLTSARKVLLGKIDRQIKKLVYEGVAYLNDTMPISLLRECLYVITLSNHDGDYSLDVKQSFGLTEFGVTDAELIEEERLMNGPGGNLLASVSMNMKEEVLAIKEVIDLGQQDVSIDHDSLENMAQAFERVSSVLLMLGIAELGRQLKSQARDIRLWIAQADKMDQAKLQRLADLVVNTEQVLADLSMRTDAADEAQGPSSGEADSANERQLLPANILEDAQLNVVSEARVDLDKGKQALAAFINNPRDQDTIEPVPNILHDVHRALGFLQLDRAAKVIAACHAFIDRRMMGVAEDALPRAIDIDVLADALSSIDFFLESMEAHKPLGDGILQVAEESVAELGFKAQDLG